MGLGKVGAFVYSFSLACLLGEGEDIVADTVGLGLSSCGLQLGWSLVPSSEIQS